jgi:myosin heavy subunit
MIEKESIITSETTKEEKTEEKKEEKTEEKKEEKTEEKKEEKTEEKKEEKTEEKKEEKTEEKLNFLNKAYKQVKLIFFKENKNYYGKIDKYKGKIEDIDKEIKSIDEYIKVANECIQDPETKIRTIKKARIKIKEKEEYKKNLNIEKKEIVDAKGKIEKRLKKKETTIDKLISHEEALKEEKDKEKNRMEKQLEDISIEKIKIKSENEISKKEVKDLKEKFLRITERLDYLKLKAPEETKELEKKIAKVEKVISLRDKEIEKKEKEIERQIKKITEKKNKHERQKAKLGGMMNKDKKEKTEKPTEGKTNTIIDEEKSQSQESDIKFDFISKYIKEWNSHIKRYKKETIEELSDEFKKAISLKTNDRSTLDGFKKMIKEYYKTKKGVNIKTQVLNLFNPKK